MKKALQEVVEKINKLSDEEFYAELEKYEGFDFCFTEEFIDSIQPK